MQLQAAHSASQEQIKQLEQEKNELQEAARKLQEELVSQKRAQTANPSVMQEEVTVQ